MAKNKTETFFKCEFFWCSSACHVLPSQKFTNCSKRNFTV